MDIRIIEIVYSASGEEIIKCIVTPVMNKTERVTTLHLGKAKLEQEK